MRFQEVDFLGGFYADESLLWSSQDVVNWLPTVAKQKGTRSQVQLKTPPGLAYFTRCGVGPIRGMRDVEGKLFVVSGTGLYEVALDGTPTLRGTIPGSGRVSMAHNKRGYGNQLLVVNSDAGYVWNTSTSTFTKITDTGYPGAVMADYLDHYLIQVDPWGRFWFNSDLDDALSYNTLDQYDAEAAPDKLKAIAANQLEAVVFGERTVEFFSNTGAATNTFQSKRIVIERGIAGRHTLVKLDNTLMWLGNDGVFYRLNGYGAQPISEGVISQAIIGLNWESAFGFTWEDKGYKVAYWTFPDGQTWGYDVTQPPGYQWHRRESFGMDRWRLNACVKWQGRWIGGDFQNGILYVLDWSEQHEMGVPMVSERTGPTASANQNAIVCPYIEFLFDTSGPDWDGASGLPPSLSITGDLPGGLVDDVVSYAYTVTDGYPPITVSIQSGALPTGLSMDSNGLVTGTFTAAGNYSWTVLATDANGNTDTLPDTATVAELAWVYQANAYGVGLGGTSAQHVPMAFGSGSTLLVAGPREGTDPGGVGARFYLSTDYGLNFSFTYVAASLSEVQTLMVYGNATWVTFSARSTYVYTGGVHTYTAGAISGSWSGSTWVTGCYTGSYFLASSNGTDGMWRSPSGIGATWTNIGTNLPGGLSSSTLQSMLAFPGVGVNPAHGAVVALRTATTGFVYSFDSGSSWSSTTYTTATAGAKAFACSAQSGDRAVFVTTVSNGAGSGLEFIYTDDYGVSFDSVFVLYSAMPADMNNGNLWRLLRAHNKWFLAFSQGGAGTKSLIAEVSDDFTTFTLETITNQPAPLATGGPSIMPAIASDGIRAAYGWRKVGGSPAMFFYR